MPASAPLSAGKVRGLSASSTREGIFRILAVDHRDSLRVVLDPDEPDSVEPGALTNTKLELIAALGSRASAVMLDPEYSIAQAIVSRALPGDVGFLAAIEEQGYLGDPNARQTTLLDGWSIEKAKRVGATGVKLLVLYRPDAGEVTDRQDALISSVVADCAQHDIPLFLEPLSYSTDPGLSTDSEAFAARRRSIVIGSVERLSALRPDVLKVQFPVDTRYESDRAEWAEACAELDDAAGVPWALLSGGDPYELFRDQVQVACEAGASGFMVGRALWGDYVTAPHDQKESLLNRQVVPRFEELCEIAAAFGRDWADSHTLTDVGDRWYVNY